MKYKYLTSIFTIVFLLFVQGMSIMEPDNQISNLEGRTLQVMPTIENLKISDSKYRIRMHIKGILDGTLFSKWDDYFSDNIYARDIAVNSYVSMQNIFGKKYINDTYIGDDGYIMSIGKLEQKTQQQLEEASKHFNNIANNINDSEMYMVNLPRKYMLYEDKMPINNYVSPENSYMDVILENLNKDKINVVDARIIMNKNDDLYFKTDHHWNMSGTYNFYNYIINEMNKKFPEIGLPNSKDKFQVETYKNVFVGTDGRKVGKLINYADDIEIYKQKEFKNYKVLSRKGEIELIKQEILTDNNPNNDYSAYLGGDNPEVLIDNHQSNNNLKIVMIGDSMDNALIPLMAPHFNELYSFDQREYTGFKGNLDLIVKKIKPDIIMFIGMSNNIIEGSNSSVFKWDI